MFTNLTSEQYSSFLQGKRIRRTKDQINRKIALSSLYLEADRIYGRVMNDLNNIETDRLESPEISDNIDQPLERVFYRRDDYIDLDSDIQDNEEDYPFFEEYNPIPPPRVTYVRSDSPELDLDFYKNNDNEDNIENIDNPLNLPENLINWRDKVLELDSTPIYEQLEYLRNKVSELREAFYVGRNEIIDRLNRERTIKLNELDNDFKDVDMSIPRLRRLYLSEQQTINRSYDDLINTEINAKFPENNEFIESLQPFFGDFFYTCYGLEKNDNLLPHDVMMTIKITWKEKENVNGEMVWKERSKKIRYDMNNKYTFFYYMISAAVGYMCYNDRTKKNEKDEQGQYLFNTIHIRGVQKQIVTNHEVKVERDLNAKGGYFPYYIKSGYKSYEIYIGNRRVVIEVETIMLFATYYQIYIKDMVSLNNDIRKLPCLYYAINRYLKGNVNKKVLKRLLTNGQFIRTSSLHDICSMLDIELGLYQPKNNGRHQIYNKGGKTKVKLGLYKNHFFSWEKAPSLERHNIFSVLEGLENAGYFEEIPARHRMEIDAAYKLENPILFEDRVKWKGETHSNGKLDLPRPYKFKKDEFGNELFDKEFMYNYNQLCRKEVLFELREELESIGLNINDKPSGYSNDVFVPRKERWFNKYDKVAAFDVETYTDQGKLEFLLGSICYTSTDEIMNDKSPGFTFIPIMEKGDIVDTFINMSGNILVYIHNLKFDINFLYSMCKRFNVRMTQYIEKSGNIYSVTFRLYKFYKTKTHKKDGNTSIEAYQMSDEEVFDFLELNGLNMSYFIKQLQNNKPSETPENIREAKEYLEWKEEHPKPVRNKEVSDKVRNNILQLMGLPYDEVEIDEGKVRKGKGKEESEEPEEKNTRPTTRDGYYVSCKSNEIKFVDSLKIITMPLRDFNKSFNLGETYKEYCNYEFYNYEYNRSSDLMISVNEYVKEPNEIDYARESITRVGLNPEAFNPLDYFYKYCEADCEVLLKGLLAFRGYLSQAFDEIVEYFNVPLPIRSKLLGLKPTLELFDYLTISSVAHEVLVHLGCYTDVIPLRGGNREFMMRCLIGGRCACTTYVEGRVVTEPVVALDAVSLYPSAMSICPGIPTGYGKITDNLAEMNHLIHKSKNNSVYFGMRCVIKYIEQRAYSLPAFNYKKMWMHGMKDLVDKEIYMDSITYNDYVKLYGIRVEPIEMIYWGSFNTKINEVIIRLFMVRAAYKNDGKKQLSDVIKRLLNSCYGKTIMKVSDSKWYIDPKSSKDDVIMESFQLDDSNALYPTTMVRKLSPTFGEKNFSHFGVMILSMSKKIMNEVLRLAKYGSIFYQDTDSYHILKSEVEPLSEIFKKVFKKELQGKNLCQLHIDYDCEGRNLDNITSVLSVYICPKVYFEWLSDIADMKFEENFFRCKGVPEKSIIKYCEENNISIMSLFLTEKKHKFNLLEGVADIKIEGWGKVTTYENGFCREINFDYEQNVKDYWNKVWRILLDPGFAKKYEAIQVERGEFEDAFNTHLENDYID